MQNQIGGHETSFDVQDLIKRLVELRDANDSLTDQERAELRATFLDELASRHQMPYQLIVVFLAFILFGIVGIIYCFRHGVPGASLVPSLPAVASVYIWWRMRTDYTATSNLSCDARTAIVDELATKGLISADEADALKTRIKKMSNDQ